MTISELHIQLDISLGNEIEVLKQHAHETSYGSYLFVDSSDGHCYLFDEHGHLDDISKVKSVEDWAFYDCKSLKSIIIPDSVKSIRDFVFASCTSLISIVIPDSVESVGDYAFGNCTSLKEVIFKGKTMGQVKAMDYYPWGIEDTSVIRCR